MKRAETVVVPRGGLKDLKVEPAPSSEREAQATDGAVEITVTIFVTAGGSESTTVVVI